jgi:formylglycine-generating enzyme required for sulfatase activity
MTKDWSRSLVLLLILPMLSSWSGCRSPDKKGNGNSYDLPEVGPALPDDSNSSMQDDQTEPEGTMQDYRFREDERVDLEVDQLETKTSDICVSDCERKECGEDACGRTCGICESQLVCVDGSCVGCGDGRCLAAEEDNCNCPADCSGGCSGCCEETTCVSGEADHHCGQSGELCIDCAGQGNSCVGGSCLCLCGDAMCCDHEDNCSCPSDCEAGCLGCCDGASCLAGSETSHCGLSGNECSDCTGVGASCLDGECECICGDGLCCYAEDCAVCPEDCGECCGNALCVGEESCCSCPSDCGGCCGNGKCDCGETGQTCPYDCDWDVMSGFAQIVGGGYWMGSPDGVCPDGYPAEACIDEPGRFETETLHFVEITHNFAIQVNEVTQSDWNVAFDAWNPSAHSDCGNDCPVETVSSYDAFAYANWRSEQGDLAYCYSFIEVACVEGAPPADGSDYTHCLDNVHKGIKKAVVELTGGIASPYDCKGFRLPTEEEWEFAARAGTISAYHNGLASDEAHLICQLPFHLTGIAWYCGTEDKEETRPVSGKAANAWGLFDMSGNVSEWCFDEFCSDETCSSSTRAIRGGSAFHSAKNCRSASRRFTQPWARSGHIGFRLVRTMQPN